MKEIRSEGRLKKIEVEENLSDQRIFKKVQMPIFSGIDLDSWLFRAD